VAQFLSGEWFSFQPLRPPTKFSTHDRQEDGICVNENSAKDKHHDQRSRKRYPTVKGPVVQANTL